MKVLCVIYTPLARIEREFNSIEEAEKYCSKICNICKIILKE